MTQFHYSNIMECSKSAEFPKFVKNLAWELDLKIDIEIDESGLIFKRQTTRFKVSGASREKVEIFARAVNGAVDDYQNRISNVGISGYGISGCR